MFILSLIGHKEGRFLMTLFGPFIILIAISFDYIKTNSKDLIKKHGPSFKKLLVLFIFMQCILSTSVFLNMSLSKDRGAIDTMNFLRRESEYVKGINFYTDCH